MSSHHRKQFSCFENCVVGVRLPDRSRRSFSSLQHSSFTVKNRPSSKALATIASLRRQMQLWSVPRCPEVRQVSVLVPLRVQPSSQRKMLMLTYDARRKKTAKSPTTFASSKSNIYKRISHDEVSSWDSPTFWDRDILKAI